MGDSVSKLSWLAALLLASALACRHKGASGGDVAAKAGADSGGGDSSKKSASDSAGGDKADKGAATPVTMSVVTPRTIEVTVSGTGEIDAIEDERVRAPFNGLLTALTVNIGDRVAAGQTIGTMIAENIDAALRGARSMVSAARTPGERAAASEALRVAEATVVHTPLRTAKSGVVIARPSSLGERLAQGDSVISIGVTGQMVFFADIAQSDLMTVRAGQRSRIALASRKGWMPGTVHNVMPADTGSSATMRVRIDLDQSAAAVPVGMFGNATIVVAQHVNVPAVPKAALLRDDITGVTQVAVVGKDSIAHWVQVVPGVEDSAWVEIVSPRLTVGGRVITTGQVGLPDSTRVVATAPDTASAPGKPRK